MYSYPCRAPLRATLELRVLTANARRSLSSVHGISGRRVRDALRETLSGARPLFRRVLCHRCRKTTMYEYHAAYFIA